MIRLKPLISEFQIAEKISEIATHINHEFRDRSEPLVIIFILKGALCFTADLIRQLKIPFVLEAIQAASYGQAGTKPTALQTFGIERLEIDGKDLLLLDDILDSGQTLKGVTAALKEKGAKSIHTIVLLRKHKAKNIAFQPDHVLFDIEDDFVVGYGLDYKEEHRGLKEICILT